MHCALHCAHRLTCQPNCMRGSPAGAIAAPPPACPLQPPHNPRAQVLLALACARVQQLGDMPAGLSCIRQLRHLATSELGAHPAVALLALKVTLGLRVGLGQLEPNGLRNEGLGFGFQARCVCQQGGHAPRSGAVVTPHVRAWLLCLAIFVHPPPPTHTPPAVLLFPFCTARHLQLWISGRRLSQRRLALQCTVKQTAPPAWRRCSSSWVLQRAQAACVQVNCRLYWYASHQAHCVHCVLARTAAHRATIFCTAAVPLTALPPTPASAVLELVFSRFTGDAAVLAGFVCSAMAQAAAAEAAGEGKPAATASSEGGLAALALEVLASADVARAAVQADEKLRVE